MVQVRTLAKLEHGGWGTKGTNSLIQVQDTLAKFGLLRVTRTETAGSHILLLHMGRFASGVTPLTSVKPQLRMNLVSNNVL